MIMFSECSWKVHWIVWLIEWDGGHDVISLWELLNRQHGDDLFLMISTIDGTWMVAYDYNKLLCLLIWEALSSPTLFTSIFLVGGTRGKHQINQETLFIGVDISLKRRTKRCRASSAKKYQKKSSWQEWSIKNKGSSVFSDFFTKNSATKIWSSSPKKRSSWQRNRHQISG